MKMKLFVLLILVLFSSETIDEDVAKTGERNDQNIGVLKFEEDEYIKKQFTSKYIEVSKIGSKWRAARFSKIENKSVRNRRYDNEETAAHASDTLARKLMSGGERKLKSNFPDDEAEVHPLISVACTSSEYIGVCYHKISSKWYARRWSKNENKNVFNGYYDKEETAAHASDTLARKLMNNGRQGHKLNFPDDETEVHTEKKSATSKYIGVAKRKSKWFAQRWSKNEHKNVFNGYYDDEETAAHASDTLAEKLLDKGEYGHKLNFPKAIVTSQMMSFTNCLFFYYHNKRKRLDDSDDEYVQ